MNGKKAAFSTYGPFEAAAPGVDVISYYDATHAAYWSGTSFSAPTWAGAIALLMSVNPKLTTAEADHIIYKTATVLVTGYFYCPGNPHGILRIPDLASAVKFAQNPHVFGGH